MPNKITPKSIPSETTKSKEEHISRIHVRGGFSDSIDLNSFSAQKQYAEFSDRTRMMISNKLYQTLESFFELRKHALTDIQYKYAPNKEDDQDFCVYILASVFNERVGVKDDYEYNWRGIFEKLHFVIKRAPYNEVLDIVWVICNWLANNYLHHANCMYETMNYVFERECIGYQFVDGKIVKS